MKPLLRENLIVDIGGIAVRCGVGCELLQLELDVVDKPFIMLVLLLEPAGEFRPFMVEVQELSSIFKSAKYL